MKESEPMYKNSRSMQANIEETELAKCKFTKVSSNILLPVGLSGGENSARKAGEEHFPQEWRKIAKNGDNHKENNEGESNGLTKPGYSLVPHLKSKTKVLPKKALSSKQLRKKPLLKLPKIVARKFAEMDFEEKANKSEESVEAEGPRKLRWYDKRPRVIFNRYYRENFMIRYTERKYINNGKRLTVAFVWNSTVGKCQGAAFENITRAIKEAQVKIESPRGKAGLMEQLSRHKKVISC